MHTSGAEAEGGKAPVVLLCTAAVSAAAAVSTLGGLLDLQVPLLFAVAEQDPPFSHAQVAALTAAWFARHGSVPQVVWSEGHNRISVRKAHPERAENA